MDEPLIPTDRIRTLPDSEILGLSVAMDAGFPVNNNLSRRKIAALLRDYVELRKAAKIVVHFDGAEVSEVLVKRCDELRKRLDSVKRMVSDWKSKGLIITVEPYSVDDILRAANGEKGTK